MTVARKSKYTIALLPGEGIGPEIVAQARRVLVAAAELAGVEFAFEEGLIGGAAIDATGTALPDDTTAMCKRADAVLLGAVGGPKWDNPSAKVRPEQGLLGSKSIKWNFTKFLVDRDGHVKARYAPTTKPEDIVSDIEAVL
jgi:isocitrate/isopropylmalate dehydrogenase